MSQNKYMHPRNIYKNPPNFKELAILYPEFRKYAKQDITGKMTIDFKNQEALRSLTTTLLHKDFGLQVGIPPNRLVPTLPLRLNYLLWIEDLIQTAACSKEQIKGVDIGTGASCIYPLLAAKTKKWKMLATELDLESANFARKNVESNCLQDDVTVKIVEEGTILKGALDEDCVYSFTMCNPPFFSNEKETDSCNKSRTGTRTLPHNGKTGSLTEVVVSGGEVAFIKQMIEESGSLRNTVRVYTTMVGHKSSLKCLKSELEKIGASSFTHTEFCQGHTTRWGLAWTFLPEIRLEAVPTNRRKEKPPMKYVVPVPDDPLSYTVGAVTCNLKALFSQLQIKYKELKRKENLIVLEISAHKNTWSHQRRKRRERKNLAQQTPEKNKFDETVIVSTQEGLCTEIKSNSDLVPTDLTKSSHDFESCKRKNDGLTSSYENNNNKRVKPDVREVLQTNTGQTCSVHVSSENTSKLGNDSLKLEKPKDASCQKEDEKNNNSELSLAIQGPSYVDMQAEETLILKTMVSVRRVTTEIHIEMAWLEGSSGRDAVHQVLQYVKNNLK
ncbi:U6 small nuclear RNA (adenine-(43)-N(6))-methyltransferase [Periplaneta americana]|uniref:U6 small nuclear RNA (adenine-(43)-N(6))-methyltransferase n=1 Tax=Periplaneta americana TaxID=6978 RepID=UPI0037E7B7C5